MRSWFSRSLVARLLGSVLALVLAAILLVSAAAIYLLPSGLLDIRIIIVFLVVGSITLGAVAVDVYFLARYITDPLRELARTTQAVAQGDLNAPVTVRREDEIGALADDFRAMQRVLAASRGALEGEQARYAELNELKERLLANVPHEIKTPLAAIGVSLELLREDEGQLTSVERAHLLESIQRSVLRLQALIVNMLDAASIQAGQFRLRPESTSLAPILAEAQLFVQPLLDQNGQQLRLRDETQGALVRADPARITQVLINLVSNAIKHGAPNLPIEIDATLNNHAVRVQVCNQGPPVPLEEQQRLLAPANAAGPAPTAPGAGLGLAIARAIVELHHGQIGLTSDAAQGTTVWFSLPLAPRDAGDAEADLE